MAARFGGRTADAAAMRVIWSPAALDDIARIYDYVEAFNPRAAADLAERLVVAGNALQNFPERGRHGQRWPLP